MSVNEEDIGRLGAMGEHDPAHVQYDAPSQTVSAIISKMDEMVDAMKALTAKLDADSGDTGGDSDYAALVSDSIEKLKFEL